MKLHIKILLLSIAVYLAFTGIGYAFDEKDIESKEPMTVEELYKAMGYTKVKTAIKQYESEFEMKVSLPGKLPFKVYLGFGKVEENKLILNFIEEKSKDLFKMTIKPGPFPLEEKNLTLKDGTEVFIQDIRGLKLLTLEMNGFQYTLALNNLENYDKLVKIAESINK